MDRLSFPEFCSIFDRSQFDVVRGLEQADNSEYMALVTYFVQRNNKPQEAA